MSGEGPRRVHFGPWVLLVGTDLLAVSMLARCFSGPGELALALPTCALAHLFAGGGRRLAARRAVARTTARAGATPAIAISSAGWVLALVAGFLLPLAAVDGARWSIVLPLGPAFHAASSQLAAAWKIFSDKVAPVAETPGFVLATAWAGGAVALASEVLYADAGLPAILALVPAFDVVVFTGTLGTATGRAVELAAIAALALSFLMLAQTDRRPERTVVVARIGQSQRRPASSQGGARRLAVPWVAVAAAVAAGVVGPVIPGATSAPLVAWHGVSPRRSGGSGPGGPSHAKPNRIYVNDLVQVAEQEIEDTSALLFTVHSPLRLRETLLTLDHFDGNAWTRVPSHKGQSAAVPQFSTPLGHLAAHPPAPVALGGGTEALDQVIEISGLGGSWLPSPGLTLGIDGISGASRLGGDGPTAVLQPLSDNFTYGIRAEAPPSAAADAGLLSSAPPVSEQGAVGHGEDLQLPQPVPAALKTLAADIVGTTTSPFEKALRLQDYFLTGRFTYHLPTVAPSGAIADSSQSYRALEAFLFSTRTGYCQQFATAFAVLARIEGLPTRIAVGFLPGKEVGRNEYLVTGAQVHAWPEVDLGTFGWVTFEPTPGASPLPSGQQPPPGAGGGTVPKTRQPPSGENTSRFRINNGNSPTSKKHGGPLGSVHTLTRSAGSSGLADLLLALLALAAIWGAGVPSWRYVRRRHDLRDGRRAPVEAWRAATWLLATAGVHRRRAETNSEFVDRVRRLGLLAPDSVAALERLAAGVDRALYGRPDGPAATDPARTWADSAQVRRSLRRRLSLWQKISAVLDPRDLLGTA